MDLILDGPLHDRCDVVVLRLILVGDWCSHLWSRDIGVNAFPCHHVPATMELTVADVPITLMMANVTNTAPEKCLHTTSVMDTGTKLWMSNGCEEGIDDKDVTMTATE